MIHWSKNRNVSCKSIKAQNYNRFQSNNYICIFLFQSIMQLLVSVHVFYKCYHNLEMKDYCMFVCHGCHHCKELWYMLLNGGFNLVSTHSLGWGGIVELAGWFWRYRTVIRHTCHGLWRSRRIGVIFKVPRWPWNIQVPI